ncbi:MAG TPA: type II toxin-antitoxin system VapC family toxin [Solirubrobacteraceae bacterium]|nr:type II toxin-antitoxin system VapC family toxin [Solirubrobacteraceae bacterium]
MSIVIDANALVVLALDEERAGWVEPLLREWEEQGEDLHAPALLRFEIASALVQTVTAGQLQESDVEDAWRRISAVPLTLHELEDAPAVITMARRLKRKSAYDASYIVLAEELDTKLWTLDGPLARNGEAQGLPVKLIEPPEATTDVDSSEDQ